MFFFYISGFEQSPFKMSSKDFIPLKNINFKGLLHKYYDIKIAVDLSSMNNSIFLKFCLQAKIVKTLSTCIFLCITKENNYI